MIPYPVVEHGNSAITKRTTFQASGGPNSGPPEISQDYHTERLEGALNCIPYYAERRKSLGRSIKEIQHDYKKILNRQQVYGEESPCLSTQIAESTSNFLHQPKSDCIYSFLIYLESNGMAFGSLCIYEYILMYIVEL